MTNDRIENTLIRVAKILNECTPYQFIKSSSWLLQGVKVETAELEYVSVQWDLFDAVYSHFEERVVTPITKTTSMARFTMVIDEVSIQVECHFNTTIRTDPYRINIIKGGTEIWVQSIYAYLFDPNHEGSYANLIHTYLSDRQSEMTMINQHAWNQDQYDALVDRYGDQQAVAQRIKDNPEWRLHPFYKYMGDVTGKRIVHLLGSIGIKGVALSLLGAHVTIVDFSKENEAYAKKLAAFAEVTLDYVQSDVFSLPEEQRAEHADLVLMELGVLHYFVDLQPLMQLIKSILKQGGQFILHEFHPISTKLITSSGKKHKVTGDYFTPVIKEQRVAFSKHIKDDGGETLGKVLQRKWTISEVVTSIAQEGLFIKSLEEEPNHKLHDIGLPKTYTIIAEKL